MSRPPSDPIARLAKLEAARAAVGPDETFNGLEMARIAGLTYRAFSDRVSEDVDFPVVQRGSEGVPFIFNAAAVLDHMIAGARAVLADRERRTGRATFLAGLGAEAGPSPAGESERPGTAARDLHADAKALSALIDARAKLRAEKVADGRLLERDKVEAFLWRWLGDLQSEVLAIEARIDKTGRLDVPTRSAVKDELAASLVGMRGALEKQIGEWHAARHP